jgi:hypothetical protein
MVTGKPAPGRGATSLELGSVKTTRVTFPRSALGGGDLGWRLVGR